ncbi:S-phase kinase-associated protein 2-like [Dendronephthya gigantea]|uniref:S-phase kinase-associated protein 2-like n=1 Tax=Dendronephthya gigantea TaxID=151771 RepID=UPI00106B122E|nr:S-phase kinase-associated protein 2-like [Dendronephthya gigantea]
MAANLKSLSLAASVGDSKNNLNLLSSSSTNVVSNKTISPIVENHYDLRWPTTQERDFTQITHEESSSPTCSTSNSFSNEDSHHDVENATEQGVQLKLCAQIVEEIQQKKKTNCPRPKEMETSFNCQYKKSGSFYGESSKKKLRPLPLLESEEYNSQESDMINYWNVFSDEIILGIFSFFTKKNICVCAKVCKRWRRLAYDESMWQSLDITGLTIKEEILQNLFIRGVVVMRLAWLDVLSLEKTKCYTESNEESPYDVQYLDASSCTIKENILSQWLSKCRNLKKLSLESCAVSNGILRAIGRCSQLSVLNLCMCSQLTKRGLKSIALGCQRLTELNLGWTNMTPESISTVAKNFPMLVKLNLSGCRETLRDEAVSDLLTTCHNLICLDLSDCIDISERSVKSIVKHGKIKHLALSRCYGITPKSLESLSLLKSLCSLQVYGFLTNPGLSVLKKVLKGIDINKNMFSTIARPTGSVYKQTIWGIKCLGIG